jgi:hypothetical protein
MDGLKHVLLLKIAVSQKMSFSIKGYTKTPKDSLVKRPNPRMALLEYTPDVESSKFLAALRSLVAVLSLTSDADFWPSE